MMEKYFILPHIWGFDNLLQRLLGFGYWILSDRERKL
jgi:hypothetical protein